MNDFAQLIRARLIALPRVLEPNGSARRAVNARCMVLKSTRAGGLMDNWSNVVGCPKTLSATILAWKGSMVDIARALAFLASMICSTHDCRAFALSAYIV